MGWKFDVETESTLAGVVVGAGNTIYASTPYEVIALNPDGTRRWQWGPEDGRAHMWPATVGPDGTVYVTAIAKHLASTDAKLYALDPGGGVKWKFALADVVGSPLVDGNGTIYVGSYSRSYAVNPDGSQKWAVSSSAPVAAVGSDGTVYTSSAGEVTAIRPSGAAKWRFLAEFLRSSGLGPAWLNPPNSCYSLAIGTDGTVYGVSCGPNLREGSELLGSATGGTAMASALEYISALYAVDPTGTQKWKRPLGHPGRRLVGGVGFSPAIGTDGTVYVLADGALCAIDTGGRQKWRFSPGGNFIFGSDPVVDADGTIYVTSIRVGSAEGNLYAVNSNGTQKWKRRFGRFVRMEAIGCDGSIYADVGGELWGIQ